jgi:hypothetical protein
MPRVLDAVPAEGSNANQAASRRGRGKGAEQDLTSQRTPSHYHVQ